jgi:hypothetical protein
MTLPDERYRAIQRAGDLLLRIAAHPKLTPGVPRRIREEAASVLRHYPGQHDLAQLELAAPHVLQQRMEPLHRMVAAYTTADVEADTVFQQDHGSPP